MQRDAAGHDWIARVVLRPRVSFAGARQPGRRGAGRAAPPGARALFPGAFGAQRGGGREPGGRGGATHNCGIRQPPTGGSIRLHPSHRATELRGWVHGVVPRGLRPSCGAGQDSLTWSGATRSPMPRRASRHREGRPNMQQLLPWILASLRWPCCWAPAWPGRCAAGRPSSAPLPTQWTLTARPGVQRRRAPRVPPAARGAAAPRGAEQAAAGALFAAHRPERGSLLVRDAGFAARELCHCSPNGRVLAAIDLESERGSSRRSQQIKQSVLAACKVRYLRCTASRLPRCPSCSCWCRRSGPRRRGPHAAPGARGQRGTRPPGQHAGQPPPRAHHAVGRFGLSADSFFGTDRAMEAGVVSGFGALSTASVLVREMDMRPDELLGGVVRDTAPVRH